MNTLKRKKRINKTKKVVLAVDNNKYLFFMELIKNLDFVEIDDQEDSKEDIVANLKTGFQQIKLLKEGKLQTQSIDDFLNDL